MLFPRHLFNVFTILFTAAALLIGGCDQPSSAQSDGADKEEPPAVAVGAYSPTTADTSPPTLLYRGLLYRDLEQVQRILAEHPHLANETIGGTKPLALASEGNLALVQALIDKGARIDERGKDNWSILYLAVESGSVEIVKYLLDKGGNPLAREVDGETLLWAAPSKEMAELLISRGVDPKARDRFNDTALHAACRNSRRNVVEVLLNAGVHVETTGRWDMPPLHSAASTVVGDPRPVIKLLLERGAKINSRGLDKHTAVHEAAFFNRPETMDFLLTYGAEPNLKDANGRTPIDLAELAGKAERVRIINLLIKAGAPGQLIKEE